MELRVLMAFRTQKFVLQPLVLILSICVRLYVSVRLRRRVHF
jgi:hypothetical protein